LGLVHVIGRRVVANAARARRDDGAIAILVALLSVVLFGFGALVIDIGHAEQVRSQAQNTVDAASLAGVRAFANGGTTSEVVDAVKTYVSENMGITNWAGCTDPTPLTLPADTDITDTCISTLTSTVPGVTSYQVRVKLPVQHVPATFGGLFGVSSIAVSPIAQALSGQPLPPTCGPCDPVLDESTGQPKPESPEPTFPLRSELPDPSLVAPDPDAVPPAPPVDTTNGNCPTGPGLYAPDLFPTGVNVAGGFSCTLKPGLYVFNDVNLDVAANASIASFLSDGSDGLAVGTGVTLVFYGTATMTVEGMIGTPVGSVGPPSLIASKPSLTWQLGQPIPGVAIVFDQFDQSIVAPRTFTLGDHFGITGSVYALDGHATWATAPGDCPVVGSTCWVHDEGADSLIATTTTAFADTHRIPAVGTDHPLAELPPSPPHLVK
jgi:Putative Flp pilus-assembly TadE/G-like